MSLTIKPITLKEANKYVADNHRHHGEVVGCKWSVACYDGNRLCGVAICGRPVARKLDDGLVVEVNRLCTDGTKNACSVLYSACARIAKEMGYKKIITYILATENGASLRASNWQLEDSNCGGFSWSVPSRPRNSKLPEVKKQRYSKTLIA